MLLNSILPATIVRIQKSARTYYYQRTLMNRWRTSSCKNSVSMPTRQTDSNKDQNKVKVMRLDTSLILLAQRPDSQVREIMCHTRMILSTPVEEAKT